MNKPTVDSGEPSGCSTTFGMPTRTQAKARMLRRVGDRAQVEHEARVRVEEAQVSMVESKRVT